MNPIRPNMTPASTLPGGSDRQDTGKLAAQRAFFEALGRAQGPAAAPAAHVPQATTSQAPRVAPVATPPEQPQKILRPGSLFDIRV